MVQVLLGTAAVTLAAGASACGGGTAGGTEGATANDTTTVPAATGEVDNVSWNLPYGEPIPLDPMKDWAPSENQVLANLCDSLLKINTQGQVEPALAESWEHPSPTTWVYKLRQGVKFWDGSTLTPEDVVFSVRRHLVPQNASVYLNPFGDEIKSFEKTGPDEVTLTTKRPNIIIHHMMAAALGTVLEERYVKAAGNRYGSSSGGVMCTGPFKLDRWSPGQELRLVRNDGYWDQDRRPKAKSVTFRFVTDSSTMTNALTSGELDGAYDAPASATDQLRSASSGKLYVGPSTNQATLAPTGTPAMADKRLRQALSLVIDRKALAETAFAGTAEPLVSSSLLPIRYSYAPEVFDAAYKELPQPQIDVDAAKKLVAQAGKPAQPITLAVQAGDEASSQVANAVVDAARQIGIPLKVREMQPTDYTNLYLDPAARKTVDLVLSTSAWTDAPDPLQKIMINYLANSITNFTGYSSPEVTKLYRRAVATADDTKRAEIAVQAAKKVDEDYPEIPLLYLPQRMFINNRITGPAPVFSYYMHNTWAASIGTP